jgi:hypothetical protein
LEHLVLKAYKVPSGPKGFKDQLVSSDHKAFKVSKERLVLRGFRGQLGS